SRHVCTDELYADRQSILRRGERHDQRWMAARVERLNVGPAVLVVRPQCAMEGERAAGLAALDRRTKGDRSEQHIVAAEEALDVLDPLTLHAERRRVLLRIHLE